MRSRRQALMVLVLLLLSSTMLAPAASATDACVSEPVPVLGEKVGRVNVGVGEECHPEGCSGVNVLVSASGSCQSRDGVGCEGVTVIIASPGSCVGQQGCEGVQVIGPTSGDSCRGGGGEPVPRLHAVR